MIRVLVADDHPIARAAVLDLLADAAGVSAVGEAADGRAAVDLALRLRPDVVLMDVSMPELSGLDATRMLVGAYPEARVLMFSAEIRLSLIRAAREAGAAGFVAKGGRGTEVLRAIRTVSSGRPAWPVPPQTG